MGTPTCFREMFNVDESVSMMTSEISTSFNNEECKEEENVTGNITLSPPDVSLLVHLCIYLSIYVTFLGFSSKTVSQR